MHGWDSWWFHDVSWCMYYRRKRIPMRDLTVEVTHSLIYSPRSIAKWCQMHLHLNLTRKICHQKESQHVTACAFNRILKHRWRMALRSWSAVSTHRSPTISLQATASKMGLRQQPTTKVRLEVVTMICCVHVLYRLLSWRVFLWCRFDAVFAQVPAGFMQVADRKEHVRNLQGTCRKMAQERRPNWPKSL